MGTKVYDDGAVLPETPAQSRFGACEGGIVGVPARAVSDRMLVQNRVSATVAAGFITTMCKKPLSPYSGWRIAASSSGNAIATASAARSRSTKWPRGGPSSWGIADIGYSTSPDFNGFAACRRGRRG